MYRKLSIVLSMILCAMLAACSSSSDSPASKSISATMATGSTTASVDGNTVEISWDMEGNSFIVEYAEANGEKTELSTNTNKISVSGLASETGYSFLIKSDTGNQSIAHAYVGKHRPQPGIITGRAFDGSAEVTWQAVPGALKYELYISASDGGTYDSLGTVESTSAKVDNLENGVTYYFVAVALYTENISARTTSDYAPTEAGISPMGLIAPYTFGKSPPLRPILTTTEPTIIPKYSKG